MILARLHSLGPTAIMQIFALSLMALGSRAHAGATMSTVITDRGYPLERHWAITEDGYSLGMFRIPYGVKTSASTDGPRQAVFLQHALLDSSYAYVCNSPEESMGFLLADAGYDVWFGNNRGNQYSTNHTFLGTDSKEFWDFTWDEMAVYDLPAQINYVLQHTGQTQVPYIGHSQGTTQAFAGLSVNSQLRKQISVFVGLGPAAYVGHVESKLFQALGDLHFGDMLLKLGVKEFLPQKGFLNKISPAFCDWFGKLCDDILGGIVGPSTHLDTGSIPSYLLQTPSGTSAKNMAHWGMAIRNDTFTNFNGVPYNLGKVSVPVALFAAGNDYLANLRDMSRLRAELPSGTIVKEWYEGSYAHLDFTWAPDAGTLMFPSLLEVVQTYSPPTLSKPALV